MALAKKKQISVLVTVAGSLVLLGAGIGTVTGLGFGVQGDEGVSTYQVVFDSSCGIADTELASGTNSLAVATAHDEASTQYSVNMNYTSAKALTGGYCELGEGGTLKLATPLHSMLRVTISLAEGSGDVSMAWGRTSACSDASADLATNNEPIYVGYASYFEVTAGTSGALVNSITVDYLCVEYYDGPEISFSDGGASGDGNIEEW